MEQTLTVAKKFYNLYFQKYHEHMDEMKMHKLMYLAQRESLMVRKEVLFDEDFFGWKFGPVLKSVRKEYSKSNPFESVKDTLSLEAMTLVLEVFDRYAEVSSWNLSRLSHNEFSWQCARKGLRADDNGNVPLKVSAMRMDAARELAFRNNTEE